MVVSTSTLSAWLPSTWSRIFWPFFFSSFSCAAMCLMMAVASWMVVKVVM